MFYILKTIVWIVLILAAAYFIMGYFGYSINTEYFSYSQAKCQERIKNCTDNLIHQGIDNVKCDINCVSPNLIIKKK